MSHQVSLPRHAYYASICRTTSTRQHTNFTPTDVFSEHHDYELFLLQNEIDAPNDNFNHNDIHTCEIQDDIFIHATNLSNTFALPQFMAQHNCEDHERTNDPSAVPTASKLHVIIPSKLSVLITQWISQCNGSSSSIEFPRRLLSIRHIHPLPP